jgi:ElaB protein
MDATTRANTPFPGGNGSEDAPVNKAAASAHGAVDRMAGAADDAVRKVTPAIEHVAKIAHQAVDKVADVAGPGADWLSEKGHSLKATRQKLAADTGEYVAAHPWKSLGFALATGFIISRFIRIR